MRAFPDKPSWPPIPMQADQPPLRFQADWNDDKALAEEILSRADEFPLIEDFELVVLDARRVENFGSDMMVVFVNRATNERIIYWDIYYLDSPTRGGPGDALPRVVPGECLVEIELGYFLIMTADEQFIYLAFNEDDEKVPYIVYCKIRKADFEAERTAFVEWYDAHPELRHPRPTPEERRIYAALQRGESPDKQPRESWLYRFFRWLG